MINVSKNIKKYSLIIFFFCISISLYSERELSNQYQQVGANHKEKLQSVVHDTDYITIPKEVQAPEASVIEEEEEDIKQDMIFHYKDEPLINVINHIAAAKNVNIVLPQGINNTVKLTFSLEDPVSVDKAWELLSSILDVAGYAIIPKQDYFTVVKQGQTITRDTAPIYINVAPEELPETDQYIRYLYYLTNIKGGKDSEIGTVLTTLLPQDSYVAFDSNVNAVILVSQSNAIKAVMRIVKQLDQSVYQETMETVRLNYADAKAIADLFNNTILKATPDASRYRVDVRKPSELSYFSKNTRIIAYDRTNHLIILGRPQAIARIKDFIFRYLDIDLESGKSILHVYQLRYLNAKDLVPVLQSIVAGNSNAGTGQSKAAGASKGGPERFFDEVIITSDERETQSGAEKDAVGYSGGNKLIIACRNDDWRVLKKLLDELDKPHRQVLIEVLIADLTLGDQRQLDSMIRNPAKIPMPNDMAFQSAQFGPGIINNRWASPQTLGYIQKPEQVSSDLLRNAFNSDGSVNDSGSFNVANLSPAGSTVIEISDQSTGSTWGILQVLQAFNDRKIISHPHIIATHNKEATIDVKQQLLLQGNVSGDTINTVIQNKPVNAPFTITLTPLLSSGQTVRLKISILIEDFLSTSGEPARTHREVITTANVNSGDILALGGLVRSDIEQSRNETPLLAKVPILGNFFKGQTGTLDKTSLTVFISPTIIEPRSRRGVEDTSKDYINIAEKYVKSGVLFEALKDPITRWFFNLAENPEEALNEYLKRDVLEAKSERKHLHQKGTSHTTTMADATRLAQKQFYSPQQSSQSLKDMVAKVDNPFKKRRFNKRKRPRVLAQS